MTGRDHRFDLTTDEAAEQVGVHPETVRRWARGRRVPAGKDHAGHWLFDRTDIEQLAVRVVVEQPDREAS